jgi:hypothetical protein
MPQPELQCDPALNNALEVLAAFFQFAGGPNALQLWNLAIEEFGVVDDLIRGPIPCSLYSANILLRLSATDRYSLSLSSVFANVISARRLCRFGTHPLTDLPVGHSVLDAGRRPHGGRTSIGLRTSGSSQARAFRHRLRIFGSVKSFRLLADRG